MTKLQLRDLVVVMPGIMGSVLERHGEPVWDMSVSAGWRALITGGKSIRDLELPEDTDIDDGVTAPRLMQDVVVIPNLVGIDGYTKLTTMLEETYKVVRNRAGEPINIVQFPYDWRRKLASTAARFDDFIQPKLNAWREQSPDARLILICHSMGGLVARYWAENQWGRKPDDQYDDVAGIITYGTPHQGSLNALRFLIEGIKLPVVPDLTDMLRSLPGLYHLLPTFDSVRIDDGEWTIPHALNLPELKQTLAKEAYSFHEEIKTLAERRERPWEKYQTIYGIEQPTRLWASRDDDRWTFSKEARTSGNQLASGDGTVPQISGIPSIEHATGEDPSAEHHGSLHVNQSNLEMLRGRLELIDFRRPPGRPGLESGVTTLGVDWEEFYPEGNPITGTLRIEADKTVPATIVVREVQSPKSQALTFSGTANKDGVDVSIGSLPEGRYRATIECGAAEPVHVVFGVA